MVGQRRLGVWADANFSAPRQLHECEAKIEHQGTTSVLSMQRTELLSFRPPRNPTVIFMGAWGDISTDPSGARRLLQI